MAPLETNAWTFAARELVQFAGYWLLQSTALLGVGLLLGWLFARAGAAPQSAIYRTTLVAVLGAPLAMVGLSWLGYSGWTFDSPPSVVALPSDAAHKLLSAERAVPASAASGQSQPTPEASVPWPAGKAKTQLTVVAHATDERSAASSALSPAGRLPLALAAGWIGISGLLFVRLGVAWQRLLRLRQSSSPVALETVILCEELAHALGVSAPEVRQSPFLASPCLVGLLCPLILLPADQAEATLRNVLTHELAHWRRRDGHWLLLDRLLTAAFFFQPLLWLLSRRLAAAAEEVCDDQVLALGAERAHYARGLAELAARFTAPGAPLGVGMFAMRSILHHRVHRIMNPTRKLSTRISRPALAVILACAGCLTLAAGAIGAAAPAEQPGDKTVETPSPAVQSTAPNRHEHTIEGRILGSNGQPAAGAHVAAMAHLTAPQRGGDLGPTGQVLAEATADAEGRYRLEHSATSKTHREPTLVARAAESAVAWKQFDLDAPRAEIALTLEPQQVIRARFVDAEGKPAAGVRATAAAIVRIVPGKRIWNGGVAARSMQSLPQAWSPTVTSDAEGRIAIEGVPPEHGVFLDVVGDSRFAPQHIALNTGMSPERGERDGTYRPQVVKNSAPGEEAVVLLAPTQIFTGRVLYADTGLPAPNARLTISASQENYGSMVDVSGQADAEGRFRLSPLPGVQFGINAYPPDGAPYLGREGKRVEWTAGDKTQEFELTLPRGVQVRGRVVDSAGQPVAGATVLYLSDNNRRGAPDVLTGWQALEISDEQGRFNIVVLPGVGRLLVNSPSDDFVPRETTSLELYQGKPGGQRIRAHAIQRIEPAEGSEPIELDVRLERGARASGQIVDAQGAAVEVAQLFSSLLFDRYGGNWRGSPRDLLGGHFDLGGLPRDEPQAIYLLEPRRKLGAMVQVKAGDTRQIALAPCGQATMRFVDAQGQPIAGHFAMVELVVSPGASRFDREAMRRGELAADADMVNNVDPRNYADTTADAEGRLTLPVLIPGATYRVSTFRDGRYGVVKEFQARADETMDLGDLVVARNEKK